MELLESQDPEKRKLLELSERHRKELQREVSDITQKTERVLTNALIVGGVMALSYFAVTQFSKSKKKKKHKKQQAEVDDAVAATLEVADASPAAPSMLSQIGNRVLDQATLILIELAREKIMEYLQNRKKDDPA
jgi:hypothetical protein